jgi:hypothetical protein
MHRERMLTTFRRARKHTAQFLENRSQPDQTSWFSSFVENYLRPLGHFFFDTYAKRIFRGQYTRRDFVFIFFVAFALGIGLKTIAMQNLTIGFDDYTLAPKETQYDINQLQQTLIDRGDYSPKEEVSGGGVCSELDN